MHALYIRVQDSTGNWSQTQRSLFYKEAIQTTNLIQYAEYFIDTDPGIGNAHAIAIQPDSIVRTDFMALLTGYSLGTHVFYLLVRDLLGYWSMLQQDSFVVCTMPSIPLVSGKNMYCSGDAISVSGQTVSGATSYFWKGPKQVYDTGLVLHIPYAFTTMSGDYFLYATRPGGTACDTSYPATFHIDVLDSPLVVPINVSPSTTICSGKNAVLSVLSLKDQTYRWLKNGVLLPDTTPTIQVSASGSYGVKLTNRAGCTTSLNPVSIVVLPKPNTPVITGNSQAVVGTLQWYAVAPNAQSTYSWSNSLGENLGQGTSISYRWNKSGSFYIFLVETNSAGCLADTARFLVHIDTIRLAWNASSLQIPSSGGLFSATILSNSSWQLMADSAWIHVYSSHGQNDSLITFFVDSNTQVISRNAIITASATGIVSKLYIHQAAKIPDSLTLSKDTLYFSSLGGNQSVQLVSNRSWTSTPFANWISLNPTLGTGNSTIQVTANANNSNIKRVENILFTAGTQFFNLVISQDKSISGIQSPDKMPLKLFPNPAQHTLFVHSDIDIENIEISSMSAGIVQRLTVSGNHLEIPLEELSPGVYMIHLYSKTFSTTIQFVHIND